MFSLHFVGGGASLCVKKLLSVSNRGIFKNLFSIFTLLGFDIHKHLMASADCYVSILNV